MMSVAEAAERLDLDAGRVRRLVASGMLAGNKIGGRWLVDDEAVARRLADQHRPRRPLSPRSAWGLLWAADARPLPWLAPRERSRAVDRSRHWPLSDWSWACQHRAEVRRLRGHPSALGRILDDPRFVRSGASARELAVNLIVSDEIEGYVSTENIDSLIADYAIVESRNPNVIVRVPPLDMWLFDAADAPWPAVAVDLLDARDDRSVRAAHDLVGRMRP